MKRALLLAGLLTLSGCGTIVNLAAGPQVFGGVRQDVEWYASPCTAGLGFLDLPFSLALDVGLLPVTAVVEGIRWASGWPPEGIE